MNKDISNPSNFSSSMLSKIRRSASLKRYIRLFLITAAHFIVFILVFFKSLYFTFLDEPGYDVARAAESGFFAHYILPVVGFPILWIMGAFHPIPWIFDGRKGWLWFAGNSYLWALAIDFVWLKVRKGKNG